MFLSYQINFPSVGSFCSNQTDVHFPNEGDQLEFESIKRNHTETIVELLSEKYLNNRSAIVSRLVDKSGVLQSLVGRAMNLWTRYHYKSLYPFLNLMFDGLDFLDILWYCFHDQLPIKNVLRFGIKREEEMKKLGDLIPNLDLSNENQTMAFHNISIQQVYPKTIISVSNFTLNRHSELIYDFRSTSTLYYDLVLPFHNKNYDETSKDCTTNRS